MECISREFLGHYIVVQIDLCNFQYLLIGRQDCQFSHKYQYLSATWLVSDAQFRHSLF